MTAHESKHGGMRGSYQKIMDGSDEEALDHDQPSDDGMDALPRRSRRHSVISKALKLLGYASVVFLSLWGAVSIVHTVAHRVSLAHDHQLKEAHRGCYCGTSSAEAKAMGCKYDSLAAAWLPDHCRDDELTAEFDRSGDGPNGTWLYWRDKHHTIPITPEEIQYLGDTPGQRFHMDYRWHEVHCLFYWRKEHRFRFNGKTLDPRSDSEAHIKHCGVVWDRKVTYGISVYLDMDVFYGEFEFSDPENP